MDSILYLNSRVNQIFSCCKSVVSQVTFCPIAACVAASLRYASLRSNTKFFFIFRVNLQLLAIISSFKLAFPQFTSSSTKLSLLWSQLFRRTCAETFSTQANTMPDSSCVGTETIPESVSVHARERWFWCDLCNRAKLRGLNYIFLQGTNEMFLFLFFETDMLKVR